MWRSEHCEKGHDDDELKIGMLCVLKVFLRGPSYVLIRPAQDHMLRLTIFNDVAVSHLFNTVDCPLVANVICWRFSDCAGEAVRPSGVGPSGALDSTFKKLHQHGEKEPFLLKQLDITSLSVYISQWVLF